jgi:choline dehydrogenase-like flavoprotein
MNITHLAELPRGPVFETDLAIIGGGPTGLTIARELAGTSIQVLILESGLVQETSEHALLAEVESIGEPATERQRQKRTDFHGSSSLLWSPDCQPYGVRNRVLGGSSHSWAGKSAAFDPIDFQERPWISDSGWPIDLAAVQPFLERAIDVLNLSRRQPPTRFDMDKVSSFYWQFARSRINALDIMRFGEEFVTLHADNIRVLVDATVTSIILNDDGNQFQQLEIATLSGERSIVRARMAILAAGGIENPRMLLSSRSVQACGIGNGHDRVGRFLMDHPSARVGWFGRDAIGPMIRYFGFQGLRSGGRTHMFMHGLALKPSTQAHERLPNAAVYFMMERAPDDPWDAVKRLLQRRSKRPLQDLGSIAKGANLVAKGVGMKMFASDYTPNALKQFIADTAVRWMPGTVVEEFQNSGVPHKLTGIAMDTILEQRPSPDSRVMLAERMDRLGVPLAKIDWRIGDDDRQSLVRVAQIVRDSLAQAQLPTPDLEDWVAENRPEEAIIIDMAHTLGTTRMSSDPKAGVVDVNCQVHGVRGLFVAGGSVFPTSGHANPTLMILSLAVRLADTIKKQFSQLQNPDHG